MTRGTLVSISTEDAALLADVLEDWMGVPHSFSDAETDRLTMLWQMLVSISKGDPVKNLCREKS